MKDETADQTPQEVDVFANVRRVAPAELLEFLDQVTLLFPEELRYRMKQVVDSLPADGDNMQKILEVVRHQWRDIRSDRWVHIAVTGPAQTGKSSLVNAILQKQAPDVEPIFSVAESPGLEEYLGYGSAESMPEELQGADLTLLVLDARFGISEATRQVLERVRALGSSVLVVLNKIDLVEDAGRTVREAQKTLHASVFATSVYRSSTIDKLLKAIVVAQSKALYPLAQSFPEFRRTLCNGIATQAAFATGLVGVIPIPVSDLLPVTAIQTAMILKISRAFGCELNRQRARELLPMFLAGLLIREAGHRLRERFPKQRRLIGLSVGGIWTFLLGQLAIRYFENTTSFLRGGEATEPIPIRSTRAKNASDEEAEAAEGGED